MQERANRYKIVRPVEYRLTSSDGPISGSGRTANISKTGILFQADHGLEAGRRIHLVIRDRLDPLLQLRERASAHDRKPEPALPHRDDRFS